VILRLIFKKVGGKMKKTGGLFLAFLAVGAMYCAYCAAAGGEFLYELPARRVVLRSPFGMPAEFVKKETAQPTRVAAKPEPPKETTVDKKAQAPEMPHLKGVVGNDGSYRAILETGGKSALYQIGDVVGAYRVEAITLENVLLTSPSSSQLLQFGR